MKNQKLKEPVFSIDDPIEYQRSHSNVFQKAKITKIDIQAQVYHVQYQRTNGGMKDRKVSFKEAPNKLRRRAPQSVNDAFKDLMARMRGPKGLTTRTHTKDGNTYDDCFTGKDLITWLVKQDLATNRVSACQLGEDIRQKKVFDHVTSKHVLKDGPLLYQFLGEYNKDPHKNILARDCTQDLNPKTNKIDYYHQKKKETVWDRPELPSDITLQDQVEGKEKVKKYSTIGRNQDKKKLTIPIIITPAQLKKENQKGGSKSLVKIYLPKEEGGGFVTIQRAPIDIMKKKALSKIRQRRTGSSLSTGNMPHQRRKWLRKMQNRSESSNSNSLRRSSDNLSTNDLSESSFKLTEQSDIREGQNAIMHLTRIEKPIKVKLLGPTSRKAKFLMRRDINPGKATIFSSARRHQWDILELLVYKKADSTTQDTMKALHCAANGGSNNSIELLLEMKAHVNSKNQNGWTALHFAAYAGHADCVKTLLDNKADFTIRHNWEQTALLLAQETNRPDVVQLLKDKGNISPNVDKIFNTNVTPIYSTSTATSTTVVVSTTTTTTTTTTINTTTTTTATTATTVTKIDKIFSFSDFLSSATIIIIAIVICLLGFRLFGITTDQKTG